MFERTTVAQDTQIYAIRCYNKYILEIQFAPFTEDKPCKMLWGLK